MDDDPTLSNTTGGAAQGAGGRTASRTPRPPVGARAARARQAALRATVRAADRARPEPAAEPARGQPEAEPLGALADDLAAWRAALRTWAAALAGYGREVGNAGARAAGARWAAAARAVADVDGVLAAAPALGREPSSALLADLMAAGDACEAAAGQLGAAAATYLDPNVRHAAATGLSHTYSENLRGLTRAALDAAAAARARQREASAAAALAGAAFVGVLSAADVGAAYDLAAPRGAVAVELYMGALVCLRSAGAAALLEAAKDTTLGGAPDTLAAAVDDARSLTEYHPLQAMAFAPSAPQGYASPSAAPQKLAGGSPPVNLALPQARLAIEYDLAPLIDRRRANDFGPLAPTTSGLNYRLLERLRTIRAVPLQRGTSATADAPEPGRCLTGPLAVTTDGGFTTRTMSPPGFEAAPTLPGREEAWAPFAGARPRVGQYADVTARLILAGLQADRDQGWTPDLRMKYSAAVESRELPSGECGSDALLGLLVEEFGRAYDAGPPATEADFFELVVGAGPGPDGYVVAALARAGNALLGGRLRQVLEAPNPQIPYAAVEREARLGQLLHTLDAAKGGSNGPGLWRALKLAFRPDPEVFELSPARRRDAHLRHFRRLAAEALAGAATPLVCSPPSLKFYASVKVRPGL